MSALITQIYNEKKIKIILAFLNVVFSAGVKNCNKSGVSRYHFYTNLSFMKYKLYYNLLTINTATTLNLNQRKKQFKTANSTKLNVYTVISVNSPLQKFTSPILE